MSAKKTLLDTGVIVALVNAADPDHDRCKQVWANLRAHVVTVEGVLVESTHLLARARGGAEAAIGLVLDTGASLIAPTEPRLRRAAVLMKKYRDTPMDLVDALLVVSAEDAGIVQVLTLDRRGFETYRIRGRKRFEILP